MLNSESKRSSDYGQCHQSPHSGEHVLACLRETMNAAGLDASKISKIVSDGGSNLLRAVRLSRLQPEPIPDENEFSDEDDSDEEFDEGIVEAAKNLVTSISADLRTHMGLHRTPCVAHGLQRVVYYLDTHHHDSAPARRKARKIISHFKHSSKACEALAALHDLVVLSASRTRWSSMYLALFRLVLLREPITQLIRDEIIPCESLTIQEWDSIDTYLELAKPFCDATHSLEAEHTSTISYVLPSLAGIRLYLDGVTSPFATALIAKLDAQFADLTDPRKSTFEPIFVASTALNPSVSAGLSKSQRAAAEKFIRKSLMPDGATPPSSPPQTTQNATVSTHTPVDSSPVKLYLESISDKKPATRRAAAPSPCKEYDDFKAAKFQLNYGSDILMFWHLRSALYPTLGPFALDIMTIPATSASIERTFSVAGQLVGTRRSRLSDRALEQSVKLHCNQRFD